MRNTLIASGIALILAACATADSNQGSANLLTTEDYDNTAQVIASSTVMTNGSGGIGAGDILTMVDALHLAVGRPPTDFSYREGKFHCNRMGVDVALTVVCKDATGKTQKRCDSKTDKATIQVEWEGKLKAPNFLATVSRAGQWTISGIQSGTASLNGDSHFAVDTTFSSVFHAGITAAMTYDAMAAYNDIVFTTADSQITSGNAVFSVDIHNTLTGTAGSAPVDKAFAIAATMTFNGGGTALLVLDGVNTYLINLTTGLIIGV